MFVCCGWRISINFVSFCVFVVGWFIVVILIDSSKTCKALVGVEVQRMLLKGAVM